MTDHAQLSLLDDPKVLMAALRDYRRMPIGDGAARLLRRLVRLGLSEDALPAAAALCLALDEPHGEEEDAA
jgi:hypothetical protein